MKVMMFMKATEGAEAGTPPDPKALLDMHNYNEALTAAGILKDQVLGGLLPTRYAKRVRISAKDKRLTVIDGPFTETKEVIAGFALWEVKSIEEALEWAKKCPLSMDAEFEMRPLFSPETWDPK